VSLARVLIPLLAALSSLALPGPASAAPLITVGMPADFADLAQDHRVVADFFFGGKSLGQFEIDTTPGRLRIVHPDLVVAALGGVKDPVALTAALAAPLDGHANLVCSDPNIPCERPTPSTAAIVYDQAHFRVDLYVAPQLLAVRPTMTDRYLKPADRRPSVVDAIGATVAGGDGQPALYSVRNRIVVGAGNARLVSEASITSGRGADIDTVAAELDRPDRRYVAGLFYAPGTDLVGRRRLLGAGIASQSDTRADRTTLTGTRLVVFLAQRSRVDLFVDKRLVSSHVYEAGNQALDTSSLPDGSYMIEIRIQENGGATRTEQRFFTRSAAIPPSGQTLFFADAGVLAIDRSGSVMDVTGIPVAMAGAARRLGAHLAWDVTLIGTRDRALAEAGLTGFSSGFQGRFAILGSSRGDYGALLQWASASTSRLNYSFDLRRVVSRDDRPLIPLGDDVPDPLLADTVQSDAAQRVGTTFSQMSATLSYRIGCAQLGVAGFLRHDVGQATSYTVGPTIHWPILQRARFQLTFDGSYAKTDQGRSVAFGLRFQLLGRHASLGATAGGQTVSTGNRQPLSDIAEITGSYQRDSVALGQVNATGTLQHSGEGMLAQATVDDRGPLGYVAASLLHRTDDGQSGTQYALNVQTSMALGRDGLDVGAQRQTDSAIMISLGGSARATRFEIFVDENPSGFIRPGGRALIAVIPYRRYTVRLKPVGGDLVNFDARPRIVDVFPGSVAALQWKADQVIAMFGRLVRPDGRPVANADVAASDAIGATDDRGYFQIQSAADAVLLVHAADGSTCHAALAAVRSDHAYTALGDIICRP